MLFPDACIEITKMQDTLVDRTVTSVVVQLTIKLEMFWHALSLRSAYEGTRHRALMK